MVCIYIYILSTQLDLHKRFVPCLVYKCGLEKIHSETLRGNDFIVNNLSIILNDPCCNQGVYSALRQKNCCPDQYR